jgi:hypothetical protein
LEGRLRAGERLLLFYCCNDHFPERMIPTPPDEEQPCRRVSVSSHSLIHQLEVEDNLERRKMSNDGDDRNDKRKMSDDRLERVNVLSLEKRKKRTLSHLGVRVEGVVLLNYFHIHHFVNVSRKCFFQRSPPHQMQGEGLTFCHQSRHQTLSSLSLSPPSLWRIGIPFPKKKRGDHHRRQ